MPLSLPASPAMIMPTKYRNGLYCGLLAGDYIYTQGKLAILVTALALDQVALKSLAILVGGKIYRELMGYINELADDLYSMFHEQDIPVLLNVDRNTVKRAKECKALTRVLNNSKFRWLKMLGFDGMTESDNYKIGSPFDNIGSAFGSVVNYAIQMLKNIGITYLMWQLGELIKMEETWFNKIMKTVKRYENKVNTGKAAATNLIGNNVVTRNISRLAGDESVAKYLNRLDEYANCQFDAGKLSCDYAGSSKNLKKTTMKYLCLKQIDTKYYVNAPWLDEIIEMRAKIYGKINAILRMHEEEKTRTLSATKFSKDNPLVKFGGSTTTV